MLQMYFEALGALDYSALGALVQCWGWGMCALALVLGVSLGWEREYRLPDLAEDKEVKDDILFGDMEFLSFAWVVQAKDDLICLRETLSRLVEGEPRRRDGREHPDGLTPIWYGI